MRIPRLTGTLRNGKREICQATSRDFTIRLLPMVFLDGNDIVKELKAIAQFCR